MDTFVWMAIGSTIGWVGYSRFGFNEERGRTVSMILGAVGAVVGGGTIAPMLMTLPANGISFPAAFFAGATAVAALALGNTVSRRWGI